MTGMSAIVTEIGQFERLKDELGQLARWRGSRPNLFAVWIRARRERPLRHPTVGPNKVGQSGRARGTSSGRQVPA